METISAELIDIIAALVDPKTQARMARVCRDWAAVLSSPAKSDRRKIAYMQHVVNHRQVERHYWPSVCMLVSASLPSGELFASAPVRGDGNYWYRDIYLSDRIILEKWYCCYYTCIDAVNQFESEEIFMREPIVAKKRAADDEIVQPAAPALRDQQRDD